MAMLVTLLLVLLLVVVPNPTNSFVLPGVAPTEYEQGGHVSVKVNSLDSTKTLLPIEYYHSPFCPPRHKEQDPENLGEYLMGDRIESSPYQFKMNVREQCKVLCRRELTHKTRKRLKQLVRDDYHQHLLVDNLPVFTESVWKTKSSAKNGNAGNINSEKSETHFQEGFPVGFRGNGVVGLPEHLYLLNHLTFTLLMHQTSSSFRVVGFRVTPLSIKHTYTGKYSDSGTTLLTCSSPTPPSLLDLSLSSTSEAIFTYDVAWEPSAIRWASRWDIYLQDTSSSSSSQSAKVHWFSIVNSLMIVVFLSGMVALILLRTVYQDLARYNQLDQSLESQVEETGWKLLHGDVFRVPVQAEWLVVLVGTGCQVTGMAMVTLVGAVLGFLSPANRGSLMSAVLLLFVLMGYVAGFVGGRLGSLLGLEERWRNVAVKTALFFPGINFSVFILFNVLLFARQSSGAVPFVELLALLVLWFGISVPLVYLGGFVSSSRPPWEAPVRVNTIPRMIPVQPWYMRPIPSVLIGGVLPFGAVFIEAVFIFSSLWQHQLYYMFTFLFLVFGILVVTCVEISIVICYLQLCGEDHHWWWRAYLTAGSSALYLFLYSVVYFVTMLDITQVLSALLYFGYSFLIAGFFFVLTGSMGFLSTLYFVRRIYSELKID